METAQEILQQQPLIVVLAGVLVLTAIVLVGGPIVLALFDKLRAVKPSAPESTAKETKAAAKPAKITAQVPKMDLRKIGIATLVAVIVVIAVLGSWLYLYPTFFQDKQPQPETVLRPNYNLQYTIVGTVKKINHDKGTIIFNDDFTKKNYALKKNALTKVFRSGQLISFSELEEGDDVTVRSNTSFDDVKNINIFEIDLLEVTVFPGVEI